MKRTVTPSGFLLLLLLAQALAWSADLPSATPPPERDTWVCIEREDGSLRYRTATVGEPVGEVLLEAGHGTNVAESGACSGHAVTPGVRIAVNGDEGCTAVRCVVCHPSEAFRYLLGLPMDVNRATRSDLCLLPRIGKALADRIVRARDEAGPFATPEALLRVRGIGPKTLARLAGAICCGDPAAPGPTDSACGPPPTPAEG